MVRTAQTHGLGKVRLGSPLSFPYDCTEVWLVWMAGERNWHTHLHVRQAPLTFMCVVKGKRCEHGVVESTYKGSD